MQEEINETGEVRFVDDPGGPMFTVRKILRGARIGCTAGTVTGRILGQSRTQDLTEFALIEHSTGKATIEMSCGKSLVFELECKDYDTAIELCRALSGLAKMAEEAPQIETS